MEGRSFSMKLFMVEYCNRTVIQYPPGYDCAVQSKVESRSIQCLALPFLEGYPAPELVPASMFQNKKRDLSYKGNCEHIELDRSHYVTNKSLWRRSTTPLFVSTSFKAEEVTSTLRRVVHLDTHPQSPSCDLQLGDVYTSISPSPPFV